MLYLCTIKCPVILKYALTLHYKKRNITPDLLWGFFLVHFGHDLKSYHVMNLPNIMFIRNGSI